MNNKLDEFIDMLKIDFSASENTIKAYTTDVKQFLNWKKNKPFDRKDLYKYIEEKLSNLKNASINRKMTSILSWAKFIEQEYGQSIKLDVPIIRKEVNMPKTITNAALLLMKQILRNKDSIHNLKTLTILEFLYSTGARVSELIKIKFANVKPILLGHTNGIIIKGKRNKERLVFLTQEAKEILQKYCTINKIQTGYLWPGRQKNHHITRQEIYRIIKSIGQKANTKATPHSIRHRLAVNLVQNGMELVAVQKILGHSNINTTEIYTRINDELLHEMIQKYHPLNS